MSRMVLLQHTLGAAPSHFDWLIEPVGGGPGSAAARALHAAAVDEDERSLLSFRVLERIDTPRVTTFAAVLLPMHRRRYLRYQGPVERDGVAGGGGSVRRVASGMVRKVEVMGHETDGVMDAIAIRGRFLSISGEERGEFVWAGVRDGAVDAGEGEKGRVRAAEASDNEQVWSFKRSRPMLVGGGRARGGGTPQGGHGEWLGDDAFPSFAEGWLLRRGSGWSLWTGL